MHSESALIPENVETWIEFNVFDWDIRLQFIIENDYENKSEKRWDFEGKDGFATFTLTNWSSSQGSCIHEPFELGRDEGRPIYVMFATYGIGKVTRLEAQFYVEAKDHE